MAKVNDLVGCFLCQEDCSNDFVVIEKNYDGDITIFIDLCKECFIFCSDDIVKKYVFDESIYKCVYCKNVIENEMGEIIMGNKNATGRYCAIAYKVWRYAFMHVECYEENIGI